MSFYLSPNAASTAITGLIAVISKQNKECVFLFTNFYKNNMLFMYMYMNLQVKMKEYRVFFLIKLLENS